MSPVKKRQGSKAKKETKKAAKKVTEKVTSRAKSKKPIILPVLPTRDIVPLPGLVLPVYISKEQSLQAVEHAIEHNSEIVLTLQSSPLEQKPNKNNLSKIGGLAEIAQSVRLSSGDLKVTFHILGRVELCSFSSFTPFVKARIEAVDIQRDLQLSKRQEIVLEQVKQKVQALGQYEGITEQHVATAAEIFDPGSLADFVGALLPLDPTEAQQILEELEPFPRLERVQRLLNSQIDTLAIKERISQRAQKELGQGYHQELLREQLRQIQAELGEGAERETELDDLKARLAKGKLPTHARNESLKQIRRLEQMHPDTSESALAKTYLDWILELPWSKRTKDTIELNAASKILDQDHFGLEDSKQRILDFLGVRKLRKEARGPILLFVGPPGVGKTSLGRSIAKALNRKFVRISLGGLRDEAELRGHRRTYVGALPGRIIQGLKTAGSRNPVFMLDEIDKIGSDFRGDPASVLLEILDPEQNKEFEDLYLNLPFDLSEVMFIATANIVDSIPAALLDRMETIELSGYTDEEKVQIATRYLIPREQAECGLDKFKIEFSKTALLHLIHSYTRESGVREFGRVISAVFRKLARVVAEGGETLPEVNKAQISKMLGPEKYIPEKKQDLDQVGLVTGLAWTQAGGEILTVEVSVTKGKGQLSLTGQLGDVMRESAQAALTYCLSKAQEFGVDPGFFEGTNVHVHVPHGAIPKDGPSAGIAIATALVSVLTGRPVSRNVAMTGEVTLRGNVIAIGGLREKALAALRAGITTVIIPKENERELVEFPEYLKEKLTFAPVENISEVFELALVGRPFLRIKDRNLSVRVGPPKPPRL